MLLVTLPRSAAATEPMTTTNPAAEVIPVRRPRLCRGGAGDSVDALCAWCRLLNRRCCSLQPRISVPTFDPVTGKWVEEPRPQRRSL